MDLLIIAVAGLLAIAGATQISDRVRVAPALLLLTGGVVVGFLPVVPAIEVGPEIILEGVLPPLLYATAVNISTINFRRELASVAVLAVLLVGLSAAVIGGVLTLVVPSLSLAWAIAMGAVLSPTDAVAISIARRLGVSQRIITVLEGEGLLNDATALVVLSSASAAATAGAVTAGGVVGDFAAAVLVALAVGWAVGELTLHLRARITDASVDTVVSFTIPFLAAIPAEHMGGSGLVAAVIAGLVTGHRAPRVLPPDHRIAGQETWHTVELVLEGFIFLVMGLQFFGIVEEVLAEGPSITTAVWLAVLAGGLAVLVRSAVVAPMLAWQRRRDERHATHWEEMSESIRAFEGRCSAIAHGDIPRTCRSPGTAADAGSGAGSGGRSDSTAFPPTPSGAGAAPRRPSIGSAVAARTWSTTAMSRSACGRGPSSSGRACAAPSRSRPLRPCPPRPPTGPSSSSSPSWWPRAPSSCRA